MCSLLPLGKQCLKGKSTDPAWHDCQDINTKLDEEVLMKQAGPDARLEDIVIDLDPVCIDPVDLSSPASSALISSV